MHLLKIIIQYKKRNFWYRKTYLKIYKIYKKNKKKYNKSKSIIEFTYENIVLNKKTIISLLKEFKKGGKYDK